MARSERTEYLVLRELAGHEDDLDDTFDRIEDGVEQLRHGGTAIEWLESEVVADADGDVAILDRFVTVDRRHLSEHAEAADVPLTRAWESRERRDAESADRRQAR